MKHRYPSIVFVGVHQEAEAPFRQLVAAGENVAGLVTLFPEAATRVSGAVDLSEIATDAGIPLLRVKNVNDPESVDWIAERSPDLLLVIGWTQLLHEPLLRMPGIAALGFHASMLPRYRGRAPINWALIHDETETGNSMIVLEPGADEGDIVAQRSIPIDDDDDCDTLYHKVSATEVEMLAELLPLVRDGRLPRSKQDPTDATVMPKRRPRDGVIDWNKTTRELFNWVRAQTHPYPGAFTRLDGRKIWVWKAVPADGPAADYPPGSCRVNEDGWPMVATADGWLRLLRVQAKDENEVEGLEAARTWLHPGTLLGRTTAEDRG